MYNKSAIAGSRYSGGRPNGAQSSTNLKQNLNDSLNLTPDSASDLEASIQESCSGIISFNNINYIMMFVIIFDELPTIGKNYILFQYL